MVEVRLPTSAKELCDLAAGKLPEEFRYARPACHQRFHAIKPPLETDSLAAASPPEPSIGDSFP
jgi:hypothetical protein